MHARTSFPRSIREKLKEKLKKYRSAIASKTIAPDSTTRVRSQATFTQPQPAETVDALVSGCQTQILAVAMLERQESRVRLNGLWVGSG